MDELAKIRRVLGRLNPAAPHDVVLVLDATTGQNALSQIEVFKEVAGVTGLVMTKLDGTARGGVLVAAAEQYGLPIHAIGVGEGIDDLRPFDATETGARDRGRAQERRTHDPDRQSQAPGRLDLRARFRAAAPVLRRLRRSATSSSAPAVFMAAILVAMVISLVKIGRVSPMTLDLGGAGDRLRRTHHLVPRPDNSSSSSRRSIYAGFALLLFAAWRRAATLLKMVLGAAFEGLTERGWLKLSRNWAFFFTVMAVAQRSGCAPT